jgi:hypothetical protein
MILKFRSERKGREWKHWSSAVDIGNVETDSIVACVEKQEMHT